MIKPFALLVAAALAVPALSAHAIVITFEEGLGHDRTSVNAQYTGVSFLGSASGSPWLFADSTVGDAWNFSSWPGGQVTGNGQYWINDSVAASPVATTDAGLIRFSNQNATFVSVNYTALSLLYLEAYDAQGTLLTTSSGPANLRYANANASGPGTLTVTAPAGTRIASVLIHDSTNYWIADNLVTDATGIAIPAQIQITSFRDANANGLLDGGEELISGSNFAVTGPNGYDAVVTTGAGGSANLAGLPDGLYSISEVAPPGATLPPHDPVMVNVIQGQTAPVTFAAVPEPASLACLLPAAAVLLRRRR